MGGSPRIPARTPKAIRSPRARICPVGLLSVLDRAARGRGPSSVRPPRAAIPGADTRWVELRWAARAEAVVHLDDLLLRRTRVGHLLRDGGAAILPRVRAICAAELGWDDARWSAEEAAYRALWRRCYALPEADADIDADAEPTSPSA